MWLWGATPSILARAVSSLFWFARCLSPLQHVKEADRRLRRRHEEAARRGAAQRYQGRKNFEARHTEIYFLAFATLMAGAYLAWTLLDLGTALTEPGRPGPTILAISILFLAAISMVETFTWISYYLLWRNFAEPNYTLYHPAEYFVLFPVVLLLQCLDLALLYDRGIMETCLLMVGAADGGPVLPRLLGQYYFVVIIANLLSMFPATRFKPPTVLNIIGAGDVVAARLIPAYLRPGGRLTPAHLQVHCVEPAEAVSPRIRASGVTLHPGDAGKDIEQREEDIICRVIASGAPAVIASPSDSHFRYAAAFADANLRFAIEKPLSILPEEIRVLTERRAAFEQHLFALSYYGLEKALPLTYLLSANYHHAEFLDLEFPEVFGEARVRHDVAELLRDLGALKCVRIDLLEGQARSPSRGKRTWTERGGAIGLAFETLVHPLILLQKLLISQGSSIDGFAPLVTAGASLEAATADAVTFLRLDGRVRPKLTQDVEVTLTCGKYVHQAALRRGGRAGFENGSVEFDFDSKSCSVRIDGRSPAIISVKSKYALNYAVQTELVARFFDRGWTGVRYDDFDDQLAVLNWLVGADLAASPFEYGGSAGTRPLDEALDARPPARRSA